MIYTIKNTYLSLEVSSLGAEIISLKSLRDGSEHMWEGREYWKKHAPLLFPFCGRLSNPYTYCGKEYPASTHGFISAVEFDTVKLVSESEILLERRADEQTLALYPFDFVFSATYRLEGRSLVASYVIKNLSDVVMPYMFGLHPAFALPGECPKEDFYIDFGGEIALTQHHDPINDIGATRKRLIEGGRLYITDEIYDIDTIVLDGAGSAVDLVSPLGRVLRMSWSENFAHLCIWKWPDDGARYICIEPWSNLPEKKDGAEALEEKYAAHLAPGGEETYSYRVDFS